MYSVLRGMYLLLHSSDKQKHFAFVAIIESYWGDILFFFDALQVQ